MRNVGKPVMAVLLFSLIVSCSLHKKTGHDYYYDEIVIRNTSSTNVENVEIRVPDVQSIFSCSFIPAHGECSSKFIKREYLGKPVMVTWTFKGYTRESDKFILHIPDGFVSEKIMRGILEIDDAGKITPYLAQ